MTEMTKSLETALTSDLFWESINILLSKPHVINKRLWGSKIWFRNTCKPKSTPFKLPATLHLLSDLVATDNVEQYKIQILNELDVDNMLPNTSDNEDQVEVLLMELLPKNYSDKQGYQVACLWKDKSSITFYDVTPLNQEQKLCPDFSYTIQLNTNYILLTAISDENSKSFKWLSNTLLPQLIKWGTESESSTKSNMCNESLSLVSQTEYYEKYNDLKVKYGKEMVKIWPECTDASKFVYEDVAIAAYLLLLWEREEPRKSKSFVDLGCGNGLLVYILSQEGHTGVGIDVRKRNIWDMYPPGVVLQEKTITPTDTSLFPDIDWIIGNHSDELTPWIPVIAAKSSYKCNFFLLPCCAYNFDGSKYQRKNSYKSQYNDYLDYIKQLCVACGFNIDTDRLKIPSTKRICFVSNNRIYLQEQHPQYCNRIDDLINKDSSNTLHDKNIEKEFKAREPVERVKNCTQIDKSIVNSIVDCISRYLLEGCSSETNWSLGKTAEFSELIHLIPKEHLSTLKSECGGIQTLLKNNHNIFQVQSGRVGLRYPKTINEVNAGTRKRKFNKQTTIKVQQKPCWFYNNHPKGCPLSDSICSFLHVKNK
ncbi:hypothetical protein HF086_017888 [Spodoptera exigua]|uniref:tRNA (uracil-O(2)-)-methyltransferase n=1 Tax=Spodoptera exigua TaxID=7107 RepID=A0A922MEA6_SPOEX|nr:hypothetical protein HF086_017888 [Spodoptera exigua]